MILDFYTWKYFRITEACVPQLVKINYSAEHNKLDPFNINNKNLFQSKFFQFCIKPLLQLGKDHFDCLRL